MYRCENTSRPNDPDARCAFKSSSAAALFTAMVCVPWCVCVCVCARACVCARVCLSATALRDRAVASAVRVARASGTSDVTAGCDVRERLSACQQRFSTCTTLRSRQCGPSMGTCIDLGGSHRSHSRIIKSVYYAFRTALS